MNFLRLLSNTVQQKITFVCKSSKTCDDKKKSINLIGENEIGINMNSPRNYRPKIIQDSKVYINDTKFIVYYYSSRGLDLGPLLGR